MRSENKGKNIDFKKMLEVDSRSGREDQRGGRRGAVSKKERWEGGGRVESGFTNVLERIACYGQETSLRQSRA